MAGVATMKTVHVSMLAGTTVMVCRMDFLSPRKELQAAASNLQNHVMLKEEHIIDIKDWAFTAR